MLKLAQFVPQDFCLGCKGCCRYSQLSTPWAPVFMIQEITDLVRRDVVPASVFSHASQHTGSSARIDLEKAGDLFLCPCLDSAANKCRIYESRPFDCRLYPFLLARKGKEVYLAIDKNCPYAAKFSKTAKAFFYRLYLARFLKSKHFLKSIKNNPEIVGDYGCSETMEFLCALPALSRTLHEAFSS